MKFGALVFVLALSKEFAINLQLLGGVWILQTLPAIVIGLYTRWLHRWALLVGWAVGMAYGTWLAYGVALPHPGSHFGGPLVTVPRHRDDKVYIALVAILANLLVAVVLTVRLPRDEASTKVSTRPGTRTTTPTRATRVSRWSSIRWPSRTASSRRGRDLGSPTRR